MAPPQRLDHPTTTPPADLDSYSRPPRPKKQRHSLPRQALLAGNFRLAIGDGEGSALPAGNLPAAEWSDGLPPELLVLLFLRLSCLADRIIFAAVCRAWRSATWGLDPPLQLPWLLFPCRDAFSFFSLQSGVTHRLNQPEDFRDARLCGSHGGGWVTVAGHAWGGHVAVNPLSGARVPLPSKLRLGVPGSTRRGTWTTLACEYSMLLRTVVFSAAPTSADCLAAAHVASGTNLAFWRPGMDAHWAGHRPETEGIEDMIYHEGTAHRGFHLLTTKEDVVVYSPRHGDGPLEMSRDCYNVEDRADYLHDQFVPKTSSIKRYLVESRGKLLMVLRFYNGRRGVVRGTHSFRIFEMQLWTSPHGLTEAAWAELEELSGRALFLGRGCSRAVEVSQFDGLREGSIYYLDDTRFDISVVLDNGKNFCSADMGMIVYRTPKTKARVQQFPRNFTSRSSPPIWYFPKAMENLGD